MRLWQQVFEIINRCREEVKEKVKEIAEEIHSHYGDRFEELAREVGAPLYLSVEEGENPALIVPVLYIVSPTVRKSGDILNKVWEACRDFGDDYRLTVKMLPVPLVTYLHRYLPSP